MHHRVSQGGDNKTIIQAIGLDINKNKVLSQNKNKFLFYWLIRCFETPRTSRSGGFSCVCREKESGGEICGERFAGSLRATCGPSRSSRDHDPSSGCTRLMSPQKENSQEAGKDLISYFLVYFSKNYGASIPPLFQGLHLRILQRVFRKPFMKPSFWKDWRPYSEQEGWNLQ